MTGNTATSGNGGTIYSSLGGNGTGVTVTNSTFSGNQTSNAGGAIFSVVDGGSGAGDTVTVSNTIFTGNSASNGGAVYNPSGGTFVLNGCTFSGNTATDAYGGAIFNSPGGAMTISGGTIDNNSADRGGGIYNDGTLTVNTSSLAGNSSPDDGGALFNESGGATVVFNGCALSGNTTANSGGAIFNSQGSTATISGGTIDNNSAYQGGGIYNEGTLTVAGGAFEDNATNNHGGGIENFATATISDSTFTGNDAGGAGGGINNDGSIDITGCTFDSNSAYYGGGYSAGDTATITDSTFSNNSATYGGGLYNNGTLTLDGGTISANSATNGGGIYSTGNLTVSGATFTGNTATASGHGGYPAAGGGAIFSINATLVVSNSTFTNNQAPSGGGGAIEQAVSNDENEIGSLTVSGSTFSGNVAEAAGAIQDAITTMNVSNSTFTSNSGTLYAGAIDNGSSNGTLTNCTFTSNSAPFAGAINNFDAGGLGGSLTLTGCTLTGNTATNGSGGAIYSSLGGKGGGVTVMGGMFSGNQASASGGAIFSRTFSGSGAGDTVTVSGTTFSGNTANVGGGMEGVQGTAALTDCTFIGNTAYVGGGALFSPGSTSSVTGCSIIDNTGSSYQGGLQFGGAATLTNCTVSGNTSPTGGGVVFYGPVTDSLVDCTISGNASTSAPGAGLYIFSYSGKTPAVTLTDTIVAGNSGPGGVADDIYGNHPFTLTGSYNLIGTGGAGGLSPSDNLLNVADPGLAPLGNYGGPTLTAALLPGSPAIGAGTPISGITIDQRGFARPATNPDIGAFQTQGSTLVVNTTADGTVSGPGQLTLRQAVNIDNMLSTAEPITFSSLFNTPQTITLTGGLLELSNTNGTEAIAGPGANLLTVSGGGTQGVFQVDTDVTASLADLTIADGVAANGGGVFSMGNLTVTGVTFNNNSALTGHGGGGIDMFGGSLIVSDSTFTANVAASGAAIQDFYATMTVSNSVFANNSALYYGGAIDDGTANASVSNSTFTNNSAAIAGAINNYDGGSTGGLTLTSCTFTGNTATSGNGGTIYSSLGGNGTGVTVTNSTFSGNQTSNAGGAIFSVVDGGSGAGDTVTVSNTIFTGNSASNGGAVYNPSGGTFVLNGCTFSGNTATDAYGGAIFNSPGGAMTISGGTIDNNSADRGGGIYNDGTLTVNTSSLAGNSSPDDGGALFNESGGATVVFNGCALSGNTTATYGGAIFNSQGSTATISGGTIDNSSAYQGGGIYNDGFATLVIISSTITGNAAGLRGGGILSDGTLTVTDCTISDNSTSYGGGIWNSGLMTVTDSTISDNSALCAGGGIVNFGPLTLTDSTISNNAAVFAGGIWNGPPGTLTADNCTFDGNHASLGTHANGSGGGGAIYNSRSAAAVGRLDLFDCSFTGNYANTTGGAISSTGSGSISGCTFRDNSAGSHGGGGISVYGGALTITLSTIVDNSTSGPGGGIHVHAGTLTAVNDTISDNSASSGGGIASDPGTTLTIANTIVAGNTATTSGPDADGTIVSLGNNLIGKTDGSSGWVDSDLTGTIALPLDPMLAPLGDNGGPTQTMALLSGSPAINAGNNSLAVNAYATPLATDQRGAGYARFAGGVVDIGAFQVQTNVVTAAAPTSVYVDGSYAGDPLWTPITLAGGTVIVIGYDAFGTIQAGIDAVAAGGTVNIAAGTYTEQLTISQSVTLAGAGSSSTILQAPSNLSGNEIEIENSASVTISGLTVDGAINSTGIDVNGSTLVANDVVVTGYLVGLSIENGSAATMTNNAFTNDTTGIVVGAGAPSTLTNTNVSFAGDANDFGLLSTAGNQYVVTPNSGDTGLGVTLGVSPVGIIAGGDTVAFTGSGGTVTINGETGPGSTDVFNINDTTVQFNAADGLAGTTISFDGDGITRNVDAQGSVNTFNIQGAGASGPSGSLVGDSATNAFVFSGSSKLIGSIQGGGTSTLNDSAYSSGVTVELGNGTNGTATGVSGTVDGDHGRYRHQFQRHTQRGHRPQRRALGRAGHQYLERYRCGRQRGGIHFVELYADQRELDRNGLKFYRQPHRHQGRRTIRRRCHRDFHSQWLDGERVADRPGWNGYCHGEQGRQLHVDQHVAGVRRRHVADLERDRHRQPCRHGCGAHLHRERLDRERVAHRHDGDCGGVERIWFHPLPHLADSRSDVADLERNHHRQPHRHPQRRRQYLHHQRLDRQGIAERLVGQPGRERVVQRHLDQRLAGGDGHPHSDVIAGSPPPTSPTRPAAIPSRSAAGRETGRSPTQRPRRTRWQRARAPASR